MVYTLSDPRTDEVRYVGQTAEALEVRLRKHLWPSTLRRERCHRTNWIKALLAEGVVPKIELVEASGAVDEAEQFFISYFRSLGFRLVNQQAGGDGWTKGQKRGPMSAEHRRKIGAGVKKNPPNYRTEACLAKCRKNAAAKRRPLVDQHGTIYASAYEAAERLNLRDANVRAVAKGRAKSAGGYVFKYLEQ